jgi:tetratricopeptide (TPR) repeat protein
MKKHIKLWVIFSVVFFLNGLNASAQDSYNPFTLIYFRQSVESLLTGDYYEAIQNINNVIRRDPNSSTAYTIRARALFEMGYYAESIADCTQAIRFDRNNISAFSVRAIAYARTGDLRRAIADWESILRINPENTDALQNIELAQQQMQ